MLIMRKMILFCLGCLLTARLLPAASAESRDLPAVGANAAIVMNSGGEVVFEKNADTRSLIASTTKLMTALLALEANALTEEVTICPEWTAVDEFMIELRKLETYTYWDRPRFAPKDADPIQRTSTRCVDEYRIRTTSRKAANYIWYLAEKAGMTGDAVHRMVGHLIVDFAL